MQTLLGCLDLVHRTPQRLRYRLRSTTPLAWSQLRPSLQRHLAGLPLHWRLNPATASVVLAYQPPHDGTQDAEDSAAAALRRGLQGLLAALADCGAQPPAPAVIHIHVRSLRQPPDWLLPLRWLFNGLTLALSLLLLSLAGSLLLLGILGLMLPLSPGGVLLLLAFTLVELALSLRRPFVATVARV